MKCMLQEPEQTQAKTDQNNIITCWPEVVYEQVWNKEDPEKEEKVQERRKEKRREERSSTVLLGTLPVKKTNQLVLISSWSFITTSPFNEPLMKTCILLPHLGTEMRYPLKEC